MLTVEEIKTFIASDSASEKKKNAKIGQRYYEADHDIKNYKIFYFDGDGKLKEDKYKSNIRIPHAFYTEIVDQEVQYILSGKDGFVKSDDPKLQTELDSYFNENEDFMAELYEALTGAIAKGFDYLYSYKNAEDRTTFEWADSLGVVEVDAKNASDGQDHVIYWYTDTIGTDNKEVTFIQAWDSKAVYFYKTDENGEIVLDKSHVPNPRPHTMYQKKGDAKTYIKDSEGAIPFYRLDNCRKRISGLNPIKDLIDDYDIIACGLSNNIQDTNEAYYVVKGYSGTGEHALDEMITNLKAKKHIGVDEEGGVDIHTVDIPVEARKAKLELDEKNIYRFGMGLNTAGLKDTAATTNIAIKSAYSLLDLKANRHIIRLKQFMRKLLVPVLQEINDREKTDYQQKDVYFCFEPEIITNAQENAQVELLEAQRRQADITTLLNLATHLDNDTLMKQVCDVLDLDYEELKGQLPEPTDNDPYKAQGALDAVETEDTAVDTQQVKEEAQEEIGKALNGAQTNSLLSIIAQFKSGGLTADEAVSIIAISIGVSEEKARRLLHLDSTA